MAYISTEEVKVKRKQLKDSFPRKKGWKFSVRNDNNTTIVVSILEAPFKFKEFLDGRKSKNVNHFYINSQFNCEEEREAINSIFEMISSDNYNNSDSMTDYFDVGFYMNLSIGKWDKPFLFKKK